MSLNVLAICPGHNSSITFIEDGEVKIYIEEERFSRLKYDDKADLAIEHVAKNYNVDVVAIVGTNPSISHFEQNILKRFEHFYNSKKRKRFLPSNKQVEYKVFHFGYDHHVTHASCAFYNSGYKSALAFIVDGAGTGRMYKNDHSSVYGFQTESVYACQYPHLIAKLKELAGSNYFDNSLMIADSFKRPVLGFPELYSFVDDRCGIVKCYEGVTDYLGFHFIEAGKTMGLSSYGKPNDKFKDLLINGRGNKNFFRPAYPAGSFVVDEYALQHGADKEWHSQSFLVTQEMKDLAYEMQIQSQQAVLDLIKQYVEETQIKNVVLAGGYGLNCVANYFYKKNLDKDINLYVEPVSHDGGTSIGAAKLAWYILNQELPEDQRTTPNFTQNSLYYGPSYKNSEILEKIQSNKNFEITDVTYQDVVNLLTTKNIVCIFQGRSEAGPRALGNRSILFDPRVQNGKEIVNTVKKREWFRPFAGSVLEEKSNDWFDMAGLESSPYMMYAVDVLPEKLEQIPAITHIDNTCRVQTVNPQQNEHFYNLIKCFEDNTGVPILFNTSFNLAGEPLVEDIDDALSTLERSDLTYLYLPELGKLLIKHKAIDLN
ncbi:MAG: hypothetical protein EBS55_09280 [Flavobacteriaceae bacterium]|nr:hypothetical protein [Flavobacteriaceae bacterium]